MSLLSGTGSPLPNDILSYDVPVQSFTVAAGGTGSTFEITGTRRTFTLNSAKNVTAIGANQRQIILPIAGIISALVTSNTTDNTVLTMQYSTDGGTTWSGSGMVGTALTAANQNKMSCGTTDSTYISPINPATPITSFMLRMAVTDATDPTTDALTITNIRGTFLFMLMK